MHYYSWHISDYQSHTAHLDALEDITYRRMLDWLYLHEKPLPLDVKEIERLIRMRAQSDIIERILKEFFKKNKSGWRHVRCEREIKKFRKWVKKQSENGAKGGRPRKQASAEKPIANPPLIEKKPIANPPVIEKITQKKPNQEPLPITQEPLPITHKERRTRFTRPDLTQVKTYCLERKNSVDPEKFIDHYTSNGWKVGKNPMKNWQAAIRTWEKTTKADSRTGIAENAESIIAYLNQEEAHGNL